MVRTTKLRGLYRGAIALLIAAFCQGTVLTVASGVQAQTAQQARGARGDLVATGKALFEDQRYEESIQTLTAALLRPGTSVAQRIEVYRYLAYNYITLSQTEEAEAAVRGLFSIAPDFTLASSESPRFRDFFASVRKRWEAEGRPGLVSPQAEAPKPVAIRHSSPAQLEPNKEVRLSGELDDPGSRVASIQVLYRTGTHGKFIKTAAHLDPSGHFRATLPASAVRPPLVEYYIEADDSAGLPVALRGDLTAPLRIAISAPEKSQSLFASPWFWTATGAAVVGGVVTALLLSNKKDSGPSGSAPGTSHVIVVVGP